MMIASAPHKDGETAQQQHGKIKEMILMNELSK